MTTDLQALGDDLFVAFSRHAVATQRRDRRLRVAALAIGAVGAFAATAVASGIADDLHLDPTQWSILGRGSVDNGKGEYLRAQRTADGSPSTFLVEHDAGLAPYDAFLLHEKTLAAAGATEKGALCTREDMTRAETIALRALRSAFPAGTDADATKATVDASVSAAFATPCRGLEYAGEQARLVYAGVQPLEKLMPGVG
jgi:hypothetical protein